MARSFNKRPDKAQKAIQKESNNRRNRIVNRFEEMDNDEEQSYFREDRKDIASDGEGERSRDRGCEL